jgi:4-hydroxy-tetrahydrodipicolinate synthase
MAHKFSGTGVALVTPFNNDNSIDFASLGKLVNHVITHKVNYLVALGTTAETPTLSAEEKKDILSFIVAQNAGRVPVVCGIGGNNTAEVVHQLQTDNLTGVDAILSVAPYYSKPTQEGMYRHFKAIAEATNKPIILYNVPGRTASNIKPITVLRLAREHSNIVAIKEASGNLPQCMELVQGKPEHFAVLSGDDNLVLSQIAIGMEGIISVAANCYTANFTKMVDLALNNDYPAAQKLLYKLMPGIDLLFAEGNPAGVKAALKLMNIGQNNLRLPIVPVSDELFSKINTFAGNL